MKSSVLPSTKSVSTPTLWAVSHLSHPLMEPTKMYSAGPWLQIRISQGITKGMTEDFHRHIDHRVLTHVFEPCLRLFWHGIQGADVVRLQRLFTLMITLLIAVLQCLPNVWAELSTESHRKQPLQTLLCDSHSANRNGTSSSHRTCNLPRTSTLFESHFFGSSDERGEEMHS